MTRNKQNKSIQEIQQAFNDIDKSISQYLKQNKDSLQAAKITPIHEQYPYAQNGIMVMIATMGSGKSFNYMRNMALQEQLSHDPYFETIAICSPSTGFDKTIQSLKGLISKSKLVHINDNDLLGWLHKYIKRVRKYDAFNELILNQHMTQEMKRLIDKHIRSTKNKSLHIIQYVANKLSQYNWKLIPHRGMLILDDFASHPLLRSKETDLSRILLTLRHLLLNVCICVQTAKAIPKSIKRVVNDFALFPGISKDDFYQLVDESRLSSLGTADQLWQQYHTIKDPQTMIVYHITANKICITNPHK